RCLNMSKAIGIDLGTTFTCVAFMKNGEEVTVVTNDNGNKITPSVVTYESQLTIVGEDAVAKRGKDPKNTIFQVKRLMGREAKDPEIKKRPYPFEIIASNKGNASIRVKPTDKNANGETKVYCPEQVSSDIVRYVKSMAERVMGHEVTEAVITVPANFTNAQRQATVDAGEIAGLKVLRIINEPTAAALAYGFGKPQSDKPRLVLVYDLGGGTFDVSIVEIKGTEAVVKSTQGRTFLGGEDFDYRLYEEAVAELRKMGVTADDGDFALYQSCEKAKRTLSTIESAEIEYYDKNGKRSAFNVSRETFEELCQDLFEKTIDCVKDAIRESKCDKSSIDDVVLVGGSSRIPKVQQMLKNLFDGAQLKFDIPPDHAVAHGAAILAASISESSDSVRGKASRGAVRLADVTPFTLGTDISYDRMAVLIPRNTPYPTKKSDTFRNGSDGMTQLTFLILEGEKAVASENNLLGTVVLACLPRPFGETAMEATYSVNENGILNVHVRDEETRGEVETTIKTSMLTLTERNEMMKDAKKRAADEEIQREKFKARTAFADAVIRVKTSVRRATSDEKRVAMRDLIARSEAWIADTKVLTHHSLMKRHNAMQEQNSLETPPTGTEGAVCVLPNGLLADCNGSNRAGGLARRMRFRTIG
ncbi:hypothetical protein PFISCL1PPCAC_18671, partial [Pristionchus fissidentatus]